ncbi:MAG UNVERIFIED_CONTAM: helix-turn-helix domain-containing protein [Rickettsiaceae bacterium]|jgi:transcriptional regulator with XRE-family HTH domain
MSANDFPHDQNSTSRVDEIDRHVSNKLRARRLLLGLSQQSLAEEVEVSVQQIQKYEKASNRISSGKLYHFANLLDVPVEYFFKDLKAKVVPHILAESYKHTAINGNAERDVLLLIRSYNSIEDHKLRKKVLELVKSIAGE